MIIARVLGPVVATAKHPNLLGKKLLRVVREDLAGAPSGTELVAVDAVGAGVGERVLILQEGRSAGEAVGVRGGVVDAAVVAIVDSVHLSE